MGGKGSGGRNSGGQNRKSVAQHLLEGTYRADRHGPQKKKRARPVAKRRRPTRPLEDAVTDRELGIRVPTPSGLPLKGELKK